MSYTADTLGLNTSSFTSQIDPQSNSQYTSDRTKEFQAQLDVEEDGDAANTAGQQLGQAEISTSGQAKLSTEAAHDISSGNLAGARVLVDNDVKEQEKTGKLTTDQGNQIEGSIGKLIDDKTALLAAQQQLSTDSGKTPSTSTQKQIAESNISKASPQDYTQYKSLMASANEKQSLGDVNGASTDLSQADSLLKSMNVSDSDRSVLTQIGSGKGSTSGLTAQSGFTTGFGGSSTTGSSNLGSQLGILNRLPVSTAEGTVEPIDRTTVLPSSSNTTGTSGSGGDYTAETLGLTQQMPVESNKTTVLSE